MTLEEMVGVPLEEVIAIHYYPGKQLSVLFENQRLESRDVSRAMFDKILCAHRKKDVRTIQHLLYGQQGVDTADARVEAIRFLVYTGDFEVKKDEVFLVGNPHSLPLLLVNEFIQLVGKSRWDKDLLQDMEGYLTLKGFWIWVKNIYETTHNEELFNDTFIQGILEGYEKGQSFFEKCLKNTDTQFKREAGDAHIDNPYHNITYEELVKALQEIMSQRVGKL